MFTIVGGPGGKIVLEIYEAQPGALENRERLNYLLERLRDKGLAWHRVLENPYGSKLGIGFHPDQDNYPGTEHLYGRLSETQKLGPNHYRVTNRAVSRSGAAASDSAFPPNASPENETAQ